MGDVRFGISILILTLNEEVNLPECLKSVAWTNDIVVLDSFSQDKTEDIAKQAGARFLQRHFDNYAAQRNWALNEIKYKNPWVLMLDADERITPEFRNEIIEVIKSVFAETALYRFRRKDYFMGKWIRHSSIYPTWFGRLIRIGHVQVNRIVNEEYHTDGKIGYLQEHLMHYPFNKGVEFWIERHNRYSSMEALLVKERKDRVPLKYLFSIDPNKRRRILKQIAYYLPGRPILFFFYLFFWKRGFMDGAPGFTYSVLRAIYEYMIDIKIKQISRRKKGLPN